MTTDPNPLFTVERGTPDATELAALTAVLLTRARLPHPPTTTRPSPRPNWPHPSYRGPAAWRR
ncbi:acyl-CoA carboxylase subunit epsilon [Streptomyces sp. NBC_00377]|uniref:acyl-CoA carboxylase subunit epsilon n=1 Tax=unclassified Streptomyces TaxID=2593676 RepID=UPI002E1B961C|nr:MULTISPECIES: acyl-CoA carboxylase subunit epsilon [unclassified Streptomyces]